MSAAIEMTHAHGPGILHSDGKSPESITYTRLDKIECTMTRDKIRHDTKSVWIMRRDGNTSHIFSVPVQKAMELIMGSTGV